MLKAIKSSWLIDGYSKSPIEDAVLLFDGDTIVAAGPSSSVPLDSNIQIFDAPGCTTLPGLIDCHVHVTLDTSVMAIENMLETSNEQLFQTACVNVRRALAAGITTMRDCGGRDDVVFRVKAAIENANGRNGKRYRLRDSRGCNLCLA